MNAAKLNLPKTLFINKAPVRCWVTWLAVTIKCEWRKVSGEYIRQTQKTSYLWKHHQSSATNESWLCQVGRIPRSTTLLACPGIFLSDIQVSERYLYLLAINYCSKTGGQQDRLYFLRELRKFKLPQELLKQFYSAIIESVLCSSITVWFGSATKTSEDYNGQSGLLRGLSVPLCPASKNFTPPEWGKGLRKSQDPSQPAHSL